MRAHISLALKKIEEAIQLLAGLDIQSLPDVALVLGEAYFQLDSLDKAEAETGLKAPKLGIGTPGALDPFTGLMKNSNSTALNGQPLHADLEQLLGIPVAMANDANCFALAEARLGIVPDVKPEAQVVFGIIMGTGVGGGIVVNGQVINGAQGIAGEWGHNFLDESGGKDYAGLDGCVETILAGPSLEKWYEHLSGTRKRLPEIVQLHESGADPHATATMERLIHFFGKAVAPVINLLDPDVIVIGGGVGNIPYLYDKGVEAIKPHVFNTRFDTLVVRPRLGDSAGVFGAALL
ncbi:MAG: ROK family protein [Bacteroidota bacterium]